MNDAINLDILGPLITVLAGIGAAAIYIVSQVRRTRTEELASLAQTRAERIRDLEAHIIRLESEARKTNDRVSKLEGAYEALMNFKVQEIADAVVAKLVGDPLL